VLLIEDDPSVRAYVTTTLAGTIEVDAVGTAGEGLERATGAQYDAVLIDNLLPDMNGVEVIRLLRSETRTAVLPLMLFTGEGSNDVENDARNAGADDYLTKPVEPTLLEERLMALVSRSARLSG
jgi:DNA-binding response OmpR family regulator